MKVFFKLSVFLMALCFSSSMAWSGVYEIVTTAIEKVRPRNSYTSNCVFGVPKNTCPPYLNSRAEGDRFTGISGLKSPNKSCPPIPLESTFSGPAELADFLTSQTGVSPTFPIGTCWGDSNDRLANKKLAVAEYFDDMSRVVNAENQIIQSIASIDYYNSRPLLDGVKCKDDYIPQTAATCFVLRGCDPVKNSIDSVLPEIQEAYLNIMSLRQMQVDINLMTTENGHTLTAKEKTEKIFQIGKSIKETEALYPVLSQSKFKAAMDDITPNLKEAALSGFNEMRQGLVDKLKSVQAASVCLNNMALSDSLKCADTPQEIETLAPSGLGAVLLADQDSRSVVSGKYIENSFLCRKPLREEIRRTHGDRVTMLLAAGSIIVPEVMLPRLLPAVAKAAQTLRGLASSEKALQATLAAAKGMSNASFAATDIVRAETACQDLIDFKGKANSEISCNSFSPESISLVGKARYCRLNQEMALAATILPIGLAKLHQLKSAKVVVPVAEKEIPEVTSMAKGSVGNRIPNSGKVSKLPFKERASKLFGSKFKNGPFSKIKNQFLKDEEFMARVEAMTGKVCK